MAKTVATVLGAGFLLVGLVGFMSPGFLGMHLSTTHNFIHLLSGLVALYFGLAATLPAAVTFCIVFGVFYGLLGVFGFLLGTPQTPMVPGPLDNNLWRVIPGSFEVGTADHIVHILLGVLFIAGGLGTRRRPRAVDRDVTPLEDRPRRVA